MIKQKKINNIFLCKLAVLHMMQRIGALFCGSEGVYRYFQTDEYLQQLNHDQIIDQTFCDFEIKSKTRQFKVHKCLIGVASDFFKNLLTTNMKEKYQNHVIINTIDDDIVELVIKFIYGEDVNITEENVFTVFEASDYLQVIKLKDGCTETTISCLTPANVIRI